MKCIDFVFNISKFDSIKGDFLKMFCNRRILMATFVSLTVKNAFSSLTLCDRSFSKKQC